MYRVRRAEPAGLAAWWLIARVRDPNGAEGKRNRVLHISVKFLALRPAVPRAGLASPALMGALTG